MQYKFKRNHPVREINSFKYAFEGLMHAFFTEPNFRIQVFIVAFSIILSKLYKITRTEMVHPDCLSGAIVNCRIA